MGHTYSSNLFHVVYGTKYRRPTIAAVFRSRIGPYIVGIGRKNKFKVLKAGGTEDHLHLLLSLPPNLDVSKAVQLIKGGSSKWVHETFPEHRAFGWQEGFASFTVSLSNLPAVSQYIENQAVHHRKTSFADEWRRLLEKHGIQEYQPSLRDESLSFAHPAMNRWAILRLSAARWRVTTRRCDISRSAPARKCRRPSKQVSATLAVQ